MSEKNSESVKSPASSPEGVIKNSGGMPPELTPKEIWAENTPPSTPAKDSTVGMGSKGK